MRILHTKDPVAVAVVAAIKTGDLPALKRLLADNPGLSRARIDDEADGGSRTLLHVATDWPGHFPNLAASIAALAEAGAEVNARFIGRHAETPLHWAASCDDVEAIDALIAVGADIEAPGAVLTGGTPISDAVVFAQWQAARRLLEHGALTNFGQAASLGLMARVKECFAMQPPPSPGEITRAFWGACYGGQRQTAEYLLARGADLNWIGWDNLTPLDAACRGTSEDFLSWLRGQGAKPASELT